MKNNIYLKLKSNKSEINKLEKNLRKINKIVNLDESKLVNFQIATSEALINAIVHGNKEDERKIVILQISYTPDSITVSIKDEGTGFDISTYPDPTDSKNLFKEHGRGIFIMKSLVDNFRCISNESGTEYILTIHK